MSKLFPLTIGETYDIKASIKSLIVQTQTDLRHKSVRRNINLHCSFDGLTMFHYLPKKHHRNTDVIRRVTAATIVL
jgi:hypothetical protein